MVIVLWIVGFAFGVVVEKLIEMLVGAFGVPAGGSVSIHIFFIFFFG